jgi:hypothetical protein
MLDHGSQRAQEPASAIFRSARLSWWLSRSALCDVLAVALVAFVAAILMWQARYSPEIGYDESASWLGFKLVHNLSFGNDIDPAGVSGFHRGIFMDVYPPVYYAVSGLIFLISGFGIEQARATTILFVCLTALCCYGIGRRFVGAGAGFLALAIYVTVPLTIFPVSSRPDAAVPFFVLVALGLLTQAAASHKGIGLFAGAGFAYACAVLSHWIGLLAGPVVAIHLWRVVGVRFWRSRGFWAFLIAWAIPFTAYWIAAAASGSGALSALLHYRTVGTQSASGWNSWPLSALTAYAEALRWFGTAHIMLVAGGVAAPLLILISPLRKRLPPAARLWLPVPALLTAMIAIYPNIGTYGYYAPLALAPLAVTAGLCVAVVPLRFRSIATVAALIAAAVSAGELVATARSRVEQSGHIPVTAAIEFLDRTGINPNEPVLGVAHWAFAPFAHHLQSITALRTNKGGEPDFPPELLTLLPRYRSLKSVPGLVLDPFSEFLVVQSSLAYREAKRVASGGANLATGYRKQMTRRVAWFRPEMRSADDHDLARAYLATTADYGLIGSVMSVRERAVFLPADSPGNDTLFTRASGTAPWPVLGMATPGGPIALAVASECHRSIPLKRPLSPDGHGRYLSRFSVAVPAAASGPILLRIVATNGGGLVGLFPHPWEAETAVTAIAQGEGLSPPSVASLGFRLPTGEWGRDLLVPGDKLANGTLIVSSGTPGSVARIEAALPRRAGQPCASADKALLSAMTDQIERGDPTPLVRTALPSVVQPGSTQAIVLNRPSSGLVQVWQGGAVVFRQTFSAQTAISVTVPQRGRVGVEVFIDAPNQPRRLGFVQFIDAE